MYLYKDAKLLFLFCRPSGKYMISCGHLRDRLEDQCGYRYWTLVQWSREQSISWHVRSNIPPASPPSRKYPIAGHVGLLTMPGIRTSQASDPTSVFAILASGAQLSTKGTASASADAPAAIPSLGEALALSGTSLPVLHILVQLSI
jgi:hypothetical protein